MYLGIYLKKKQKLKQTIKKSPNKPKREEEGRKKEGRKEGFEFGTFDSLRLYLTTTPLRLLTSLWREVFYLMPFPRKLHRQTPLKMIEPRKTALLIVKKNNNNKNRTHFMAT